MQYPVLSVVLWAVLCGSSGWAMAEDDPSVHSETIQEQVETTDVHKQEIPADQGQSLGEGRLTKEQLRAVIRGRRERVRAEMKARRESLRAEGAELQQKIMAKRVREHQYRKNAAEVMVGPAN